ncbi:MAG: endonuclease/exonuclease/phosphatase family protein [Phycisphaeraceae bacterium]|nr:MAG: endonuclease/exonuclease/phosphatase family protein [Phycisphaeraceae bacterium]
MRIVTLAGLWAALLVVGACAPARTDSPAPPPVAEATTPPTPTPEVAIDAGIAPAQPEAVVGGGVAGAGGELTVMSFNIRYGTADDGPDHWRHRKGLVFEAIRRHRPDVLALQEALRFQIDEIRANVPGYGSVGSGRDDGRTAGEHAAILYRTQRLSLPPPTDPPTRGDFWFSETPGTPGSKGWGATIPRICTWARFVDIPSGAGLYVYNVHLDHQSQPSRANSVGLLLRRVGERPTDEPAIITGDFNADPGTPELAPLASPASGFVDTHSGIAAYEDLATFHGFKGPRPGRRIDLIFAPAGSSVRGASIDTSGVDGRYPSDHFPVLATIALPAPAATPPAR